jgi:hypothetical protein
MNAPIRAESLTKTATPVEMALRIDRCEWEVKPEELLRVLVRAF